MEFKKQPMNNTQSILGILFAIDRLRGEDFDYGDLSFPQDLSHHCREEVIRLANNFCIYQNLRFTELTQENLDDFLIYAWNFLAKNKVFEEGST